MPTNADRFSRLAKMRAESREGGGAVRVARQHAAGKLTARERIELLLDAGSFFEVDAFVTHRPNQLGGDDRGALGDGVVTGHGTVDGRPQRGPVLQLGTRGWHVVTVDVPRLVGGAEGKKVGLLLQALDTAPLWIQPRRP